MKQEATVSSNYTTILSSQPNKQLPLNINNKKLSNVFGSFFKEKFKNIRRNFNIDLQTVVMENTNINSSELKIARKDETREIIIASINKSCKQDHIPT